MSDIKDKKGNLGKLVTGTVLITSLVGGSFYLQHKYEVVSRVKIYFSGAKTQVVDKIDSFKKTGEELTAEYMKDIGVLVEKSKYSLNEGLDVVYNSMSPENQYKTVEDKILNFSAEQKLELTKSLRESLIETDKLSNFYNASHELNQESRSKALYDILKEQPNRLEIAVGVVQDTFAQKGIEIYRKMIPNQ